MLLCIPGCRDSTPPTPAFIDDRAQLLTAGERERIEAYHRRLLEDLDIHLQVTTLAQPAADIDARAVKLFDDYGLGKTTLAARGVLLVDPKGRQVRLEIGYDLEGIFTDLLVGRVERDQMAPFFQAGRVGPGLESLRIYREVLRQRVKDPDLEIYTPKSRQFLRQWLVTDGRQANELKSLAEVLDGAEVRSSDPYAVVRCEPEARTLAPYLLRRGETGWQLDVVAMSQVIGFNHLNQWRFRTLEHPYMFAFADWSFDERGFPRE